MGGSAEQRKAVQAYYKSQMRCVKCHGQDAFTLYGRSYCAECAELFRTYNRKCYASGGGAKERERKKAQREKRREESLCTRCGKPLGSDAIYLTCDQCRAKARNAKRKETEKRTGYPTGAAKSRWQYGECCKCGAPVKEGDTVRGTPFRYCERCYADSAAALKKAREANLQREKPHIWMKENVIAFGNTVKSSPRSI